MRLETAWLPDLKFVSETDEGDGIGNAGMDLQPLGQDHPPVGVEPEHFADPEQRRRQMVALVRIGAEIVEQAMDGLDQTAASGIERLLVQRRVAEHALARFLGEDVAEGRGDGHAALGIDPVGVCGHEMVHRPLNATRILLFRRACFPAPRVSNFRRVVARGARRGLGRGASPHRD